MSGSYLNQTILAVEAIVPVAGTAITVLPASPYGLAVSGTVFTASGPGHKPGLVPDPGAVASSTHFLREDGTWAIPSAPPHKFVTRGTELATSANAFTEFDYYTSSSSPNSFTLPDLTTGAAAICRNHSIEPGAVISSGSFSDFAGSVLLVTVVWEGVTTITSVVDAEGNTYTAASGAALAGTGGLTNWRCQVWKATNIVGNNMGTNIVSVTTGGSTTAYLTISEYVKCSGVDTCVATAGAGSAMAFITTGTSTWNEANYIQSAYFFTNSSELMADYNLLGSGGGTSGGPIQVAAGNVYMWDAIAVGAAFPNSNTPQAYSGGPASDYFAVATVVAISGVTPGVPSSWTGTVLNNNTSGSTAPFVIVNDYNFNTAPAVAATGGANYVVRSEVNKVTFASASGGDNFAEINTNGTQYFVKVTDTATPEVVNANTSRTTQYLDEIILVASLSATTQELRIDNQKIGKIYRIKNNSTGLVTVIPQNGLGSFIDNATSYFLSVQYQSADFQWDGNKWWIL